MAPYHRLDLVRCTDCGNPFVAYSSSCICGRCHSENIEPIAKPNLRRYPLL